jgi:hypothetical protein
MNAVRVRDNFDSTLTLQCLAGRFAAKVEKLRVPTQATVNREVVKLSGSAQLSMRKHIFRRFHAKAALVTRLGQIGVVRALYRATNQNVVAEKLR